MKEGGGDRNDQKCFLEKKRIKSTLESGHEPQRATQSLGMNLKEHPRVWA